MVWLLKLFLYICTPIKQKCFDSVAQLVEQYTFNVWALGSSPSGITKAKAKIFKNPQKQVSWGFLLFTTSLMFSCF